MVFVSPRSKALDLCAADNDCGADVLVPRILTLLTWVQRDHPKKFIPRKTNMYPENQWLEDVFPTEIVPF